MAEWDGWGCGRERTRICYLGSVLDLTTLSFLVSRDHLIRISQAPRRKSQEQEHQIHNRQPQGVVQEAGRLGGDA